MVYYISAIQMNQYSICFLLSPCKGYMESRPSATGLCQPRSLAQMAGSCLSWANPKERKIILAGSAALIWAIWRYRNDICFNNVKYNSFLQALFRGAYWLLYWTLLQPKEVRESIRSTSIALETTALEIFAGHEWKFQYKLHPP